MHLFRVKLYLAPLVNLMLDQLPPEVFTSSDTTFLDPAMAGGQFLREVITRLRAAGHSDDNIRSRIWGCEILNGRLNYSRRFGGVISDNLIQTDFLSHDWGNMKFDVVLGNPPYQDKLGNENSSNSADLYAKFIETSLEISKNYVMMVVPSAWSGARSSKLKELLFEQNQCTHFNTHGKKWFDVDMNTCWFITQVGRQGSTCVSDAHDNQVVMHLNKQSVIIKNLVHLSTLNKLKAHAENKNLSSRWLRGKLHLNQVDNMSKGSMCFIRAVGTQKDPLDVRMIPKNKESCGLDLHKLVMPNVSSSDALGNIKLAEPHMVGGHSVVFLTATSHKEVKRLLLYLESDLVKFIVQSVKISTPNSKHLFVMIPEMPTRWSCVQDLYAYFGLDEQDISLIENHKQIKTNSKQEVNNYTPTT